MSELKARKNLRLKGYNYSQNGRYFITILTKNHENILADVSVDLNGNTILELSDIGKIVKIELLNIHSLFNCIKILNYVIMPNHVHMIMELDFHNSDDLSKPPELSAVMNQLKGTISKKVGFSIWHRSYHDHIIRNNDEYNKISLYIDNNPKLWLQDCYFPNIRK